METEKQADLEEVVPAATTEEVETTVETPEQDPLKTELEKVQNKKRTKEEKLLYTKKRIDDQLKELGIEDQPEDEDDKPLTVGMFKKMQEQTATKTSLQLADEVTNETEKELLKYHLENTIKSTGNPMQDFETARTLVNAVKNKQVMEEIVRKPQAKTHSSASGVPPKVQKNEELTAEELSFMKPPFNLTKEAIIKARQK